MGTAVPWQDTPSVEPAGSGTDAPQAILDYIVAQLDVHRLKEDDPMRSQPMAALPDGRVDACLYFIAPGCLTPDDVQAMATLSQLVPVVPIIAQVAGVNPLHA